MFRLNMIPVIAAIQADGLDVRSGPKAVRPLSTLGGKPEFLRYAKPVFRIAKMGESDGHCACCGNASRTVWGRVYDGDLATAAYWVHWTPAHLMDRGANLDLVMGRWGEDATLNDRFAVSLVHRATPNGAPAVMVIDAAERAKAYVSLAATALDRDQVINTPVAANVFSIVDAIYEQDERLFS